MGPAPELVSVMPDPCTPLAEGVATRKRSSPSLQQGLDGASFCAADSNLSGKLLSSSSDLSSDGGCARQQGDVTSYTHSPCVASGSTSPSDSEREEAGEVANGNHELAKLIAGLKAVPKTVPCSYLYNELGSQLYDQIVELASYYLYREELRMLTDNAESIIKSIPREAIIVELGCGSATKTSILLNALLERDGPEHVRFIGIDVSSNFLENARKNLLEACSGLRPDRIEMICKEYAGGMCEARRLHPGAQLCFLWLGSSVGNLLPIEAQEFLQKMRESCGYNTQLFLCADLWKDTAVLHAAYNDSEGVTENFIRNGLAHALASLPTPVKTTREAWSYHVLVNKASKQVEMYLRSKKGAADILPGVGVAEGEEILMERSRKFTAESLESLACAAGFHIPREAQWRNDRYSLQMLVPAPLQDPPSD